MAQNPHPLASARIPAVRLASPRLSLGRRRVVSRRAPGAAGDRRVPGRPLREAFGAARRRPHHRRRLAPPRGLPLRLMRDRHGHASLGRLRPAQTPRLTRLDLRPDGGAPRTPRARRTGEAPRRVVGRRPSFGPGRPDPERSCPRSPRSRAITCLRSCDRRGARTTRREARLPTVDARCGDRRTTVCPSSGRHAGATCRREAA